MAKYRFDQIAINVVWYLIVLRESAATMMILFIGSVSFAVMQIQRALSRQSTIRENAKTRMSKSAPVK